MTFRWWFILLLISGFAQAQTLKGVVRNEKGSSLSGVKIELVDQHDYESNQSDGSFRLQLNQKYRFSKAGYYPSTFMLTSSEYYADTSLYQKEVTVTLERYKGERHTVTDENGRPLEDVKIAIDGGKVLYTDGSGVYNLPPKLISSTVFVFSKKGYFNETFTYKELMRNSRLVMHTLSADKVKIEGKARFSNGAAMHNAPLYVFSGATFDPSSQDARKVGHTSASGEINLTVSINKSLSENLAVVAKYDGREYTAFKAIDPSKKVQTMLLIAQPAGSQKGMKKPLPAANQSKKELAAAPARIEEMSEEKGMSRDTTAASADKAIAEAAPDMDTMEVVVEAHVDTLKAQKQKDLENIDDYVSYLEVLLEQNDINYQQKKQGASGNGTVKEEVKQELQQLKTDVVQKEAEVKAQEKQGVILWWIIGGVVLILIPTVVLIISYRNHRKARKLNKRLQKANEELSEAYARIRSNVVYAETIQRSVLVQPQMIKSHFKDAFVFYRPRDIVSGDFYWFTVFGNLKIVIAADCTGHGVPGALMTIMANSFLNEIINVKKITDPATILTQLHEKITEGLRQGDEQLNDGLDLAMVVIDEEAETMTFGGANNPIFVIRNGEIEEVKGARRGVGGQAKGLRRKKRKEIPFENAHITLEGVESLYLFSDGYPDQFGGAQEDKFLKANLRSLLHTHHQKGFSEQEQILSQTIDEWKGPHNQTDDQLIIGLRL